MAAILRDQGVLDDDVRTLLEALVAKHLKMHGGDPEKSLAAIGVGHSTREGLAQLNDPELTANLARVGTNQDPAAGGPVPVHRPRLPVFPGASQGPRSDAQEQILADQRVCWGQGKRVLVEDYLSRHPELRDQPEPLLDLIYNEVVLREQNGEKPGPDEYVARFPELGAAIRDQFEIHRMFANQGLDSGGDPDRTPTFSVGTSSSEGLRFRVLRPHRKGGLGAVFVALDAELHREVALKQILRPACRRPGQPVSLFDRGRDHRRAGAPRHRPGLRPGQLRQRPAVLRHAVHQGGQPQGRHRRLPW